MDESSSQPVPENPVPSGSSLGSRLTNVFVSPTEVFDEVKAGPPTPSNWIAPLVAATIVGIIYVMMIFSQPAVIQSMKEAQDKKFEDVQKRVTEGKMTQKQADDIRATADKFMTPSFLKVIGILGSVVGNLIGLFLTAAVVWLVGKSAFHANFAFMKSVEVAGLALMITVLGAIIKLLLNIIYGNTYMTAGPVLFLSHFDHTNKVHLLLAALSVTSLWYVAVLSAGLARLSGASFYKAAVLMFGLWAILTLGPIWLFVGK